ncbi:hypothetical protein COO60DRAFT_68095 [Scenedesmus sp. NREL 46B-D3]|nr:hypothetical protein COO60DRAFT_68095 [Scenedesmus sp. NREL 46B-D3]
MPVIDKKNFDGRIGRLHASDPRTLLCFLFKHPQQLPCTTCRAKAHQQKLSHLDLHVIQDHGLARLDSAPDGLGRSRRSSAAWSHLRISREAGAFSKKALRQLQAAVCCPGSQLPHWLVLAVPVQGRSQRHCVIVTLSGLLAMAAAAKRRQTNASQQHLNVGRLPHSHAQHAHALFTCAVVLQLYVPRIPGVPDFDERLVPGHWGFEEERAGQAGLLQQLLLSDEEQKQRWWQCRGSSLPIQRLLPWARVLQRQHYRWQALHSSLMNKHRSSCNSSSSNGLCAPAVPCMCSGHGLLERGFGGCSSSSSSSSSRSSRFISALVVACDAAVQSSC